MFFNLAGMFMNYVPAYLLLTAASYLVKISGSCIR